MAPKKTDPAPWESLDPSEPVELIDNQTWITIVNAGCKDRSKMVAFKYLQYVGAIMGYDKLSGNTVEIGFEEEIDASPDDWEAKAKIQRET